MYKKIQIHSIAFLINVLVLGRLPVNHLKLFFIAKMSSVLWNPVKCSQRTIGAWRGDYSGGWDSCPFQTSLVFSGVCFPLKQWWRFLYFALDSGISHWASANYMFSAVKDSLLYSKEAAAVPPPALTKTLEVACRLSSSPYPQIFKMTLHSYMVSRQPPAGYRTWYVQMALVMTDKNLYY